MNTRHALIATTLLLALVPEAQAQLVGNDGWSYQATNRSFHAQGQLLRRQQAAASASSSGSSGATILNNSTNIGNWEQITVGNGSNVNTHSSQSTSGAQTSTAANDSYNPSGNPPGNPSGNPSGGHPAGSNSGSAQ